jgi:uncharacterized membrane protein
VIFAVALAAALAGSAALLMFTFWLGHAGDRNAPRIPIDEMRRHVVWKLFYVNPDDRRGWVPKPYGIGWTVNLRTMRNVYVFSALVVATLLGAVVMSLTAPDATAGNNSASER